MQLVQQMYDSWFTCAVSYHVWHVIVTEYGHNKRQTKFAQTTNKICTNKSYCVLFDNSSFVIFFQVSDADALELSTNRMVS